MFNRQKSQNSFLKTHIKTSKGQKLQKKRSKSMFVESNIYSRFTIKIKENSL